MAVPQPTPTELTGTAETLDPTWRQLLMAPRVTGNLRAIAIEPTDPKSMYVGTEEGTLVHTIDGGVTWDEIEISPFQYKSATVVQGLDGDDYKAIDVFAGFKTKVGNEYRDFALLFRPGSGKGAGNVAGPPLADLGVAPYFINPVRIYGTPERLLGAVAGADPKPYENILFVKACPGGAYKLFVVTSGRLLGSPDGTSFVSLFIARESAPIQQIACSPTDPNEVILTSGDGTFRSTNGGGVFDPISGPLGLAGSSAVAFGPPGGGGKAQLYVATGRELWVGDSTLPDGMKISSMSSDGDIRYVTATSQSVWAATQTGARVSRDEGKTWSVVDDLEGFGWNMVAVTPADAGGQEHVAIVADDIVYGSADGGTRFTPFFRAQSRRRLKQLLAVPASGPGTSSSFVLLSAGELWTTGTTEDTGVATNDEIRHWAAQRLKRLPSARVTLDRALIKTGLSTPQVDAIERALKQRGWVPGVNVSLALGQTTLRGARQVSITDPSQRANVAGTNSYGGFIELIWELPDLMQSSYSFPPARKDIYEIRKRFEYLIEDAYDERQQILAQIATARALDVEQLLTLQARLEVLDVVLQQFAGESKPN